MVAGHVRTRHHDAGRSAGTDLGNGRRTCAANDQIRRCQHLRHVIDVLAHVNARMCSKVNTQFFDILRHPTPAERAGRVDVMKRRVLLAFALHKLGNFFVHFPCTEAAPAGDDERLFAEAQRLPGLLPLGKEEFLPHRCSGQEDLFGFRVMLPAGLERHHNTAGRTRNKLCRQARNGIRFVYASRNAKLRAHFQSREAGVAASTDDHIGLKLL